MKKCYILCRSVTHASKGAKALRKSGINAAVERPPKMLFAQPCGYCIVVRGDDKDDALTVLTQLGITVKETAEQ
ncbi:MAG: DUF3343 domain-containing protein [Ruminococcaceae bacterium]|nr:DUF3343 domain-containing protein [Oscillospiraceae bacterium]